MISFAIVGSGWRSEFFLRIAEQLPQMFQVSGMVVRNEEKGRAFERSWGVSTYRSVQDLIDHVNASFVVVSVPREVAPEITIQLAQNGLPVLCETPPAKDLHDLIELNRLLQPDWKIQIAEQYMFQPNHAARLNLVTSGVLGTIQQAQISIAHDYHGMSLIRKFLNLKYEDASIRAFVHEAPIVQSPDRNGPPTVSTIQNSKQMIATLHFGEKLAIYDFTDEQYFSWVRSPRMLIRGERGEMNNFDVKYLLDTGTAVADRIHRRDAGHDGNLEGFYLKGIWLGARLLYENEFTPGRLSDDEIAVATCLKKMDAYSKGGPSFYSVAEASQDHYLSLLIHEAARSGETIVSSKQPWAKTI
ncbi:Gfo/Idh/MocA family protein [Alicyclobacillus mengziensis]|uniref:Gfo/Idh/MocA family oxidoreductase n=1 Tax=Alicyclobacillus mengziensis TaxID=2931921 RepID=A0A9X7Z7N3_9BACL|nr:Gfo/Idh/MocA family oxidoreductase [Alicyclobacillus mengziensis]QSO47403.1 Gfo/Idh/MocA family oxidoreductase [Alicyclobacillus mengziensis]